MGRKSASEDPDPPPRASQDVPRQSRRAAAWSLAVASQAEAPHEPEAGKG
jgi:hypothetical protein